MGTTQQVPHRRGVVRWSARARIGRGRRLAHTPTSRVLNNVNESLLNLEGERYYIGLIQEW